MKRAAICTLLALLVATTLAGCREETETERAGSVVHDTFQASPPETYAYDCDDGTQVVAHFENRSGRDEVVLFLPGRTVRLPVVPAASGAKYGDGETSWWVKGIDETRLGFAGAEPCLCRLNPARTRWEDAKLRGVDYRALGNEPGWILEIGPVG
nr:MliC family protein [bacterium]